MKPLNRREALVATAAMLAIRPHQFPFRLEDVSGCSRIIVNSIGGTKSDRFYANLRSGRQIEINESQFLEFWRYHQRKRNSTAYRELKYGPEPS